jgi:hypothetical protein
LNTKEIIGLTKAMVNTGQKLSWGKKIVVDKHCVGSGNRTTPIVVAIIAQLDLPFQNIFPRYYFPSWYSRHARNNDGSQSSIKQIKSRGKGKWLLCLGLHKTKSSR